MPHAVIMNIIMIDALNLGRLYDCVFECGTFFMAVSLKDAFLYDCGL